MKVVILGAGQVGASVAESLVSDENDITVVDTDFGRLQFLQDRLDLRTVTGNASHPSVLSRLRWQLFRSLRGRERFPTFVTI
jgi:trk system potassium uptake protein TrkA